MGIHSNLACGQVTSQLTDISMKYKKHIPGAIILNENQKYQQQQQH